MSEDSYADYVTLASLQLTLLYLFSFGVERVLARYSGEGLTYWSAGEFRRFLSASIAIRLGTFFALVVAFVFIGHEMAGVMRVDEWASKAPAFWCYTLSFVLFEVAQACAQSLMLQRAIKNSLVVQWLSRVILVIVLAMSTSAIDVETVLWIFGLTGFLGILFIALPIREAIRSQHASDGASVARKPFPLAEVIGLGWHNHVEKVVAIPSSSQFIRLVAANALNTLSVASFGFYQTLIMTAHRHMPTTITMGMLEAAVAGRAAQGGRQSETHAVLSAIFKLNLLYVLPIVAIFLACGSELVGFVTGGKYTEQALVLAILSASLIPGGFWQILIVYSNTYSHSHILPRATLLATFSLVPFVVALYWVPDLGLWMLSIGLAVFGFIQVAIALYFLAVAGLPLKLDFHGFLKLTIVLLIPAFLLAVVNDQSDGRSGLFAVFLSSLVVIASVLGVLRFARVFTNSELDVLFKINPRVEIFLHKLGVRKNV